jgi:hypothetical protein
MVYEVLVISVHIIRAMLVLDPQVHTFKSLVFNLDISLVIPTCRDEVILFPVKQKLSLTIR